MDIVIGGLEVGVWVAIIGGVIGAIFILRAVVCWYLRLSLIASLLVQIRDRLPVVQNDIVEIDDMFRCDKKVKPPVDMKNFRQTKGPELPVTEDGSPEGRYPRKDDDGT